MTRDVSENCLVHLFYANFYKKLYIKIFIKNYVKMQINAKL